MIHEIKFQLEDRLCGSLRSENTFLRKFKNLIKVVISIRLLPKLVNIGIVDHMEAEILSLKFLYHLQEQFCRQMSKT